MRLPVRFQLDVFLEAFYRDTRLKSRLIMWTFAGLVVPTTLLVATGIPEKLAYIVMAALILPFLILVYALTSAARKTNEALWHEPPLSWVPPDPLSWVPRVSRDPIRVAIELDLKATVAQIGIIVADCLFLAIWLIGEYCLERYLVPIFHETSVIAAVFLWVFRVVFAASTLGPWWFFLYRHLLIFWIRTQAIIKNIKATLPEEKSIQRT